MKFQTGRPIPEDNGFESHSNKGWIFWIFVAWVHLHTLAQRIAGVENYHRLLLWFGWKKTHHRRDGNRFYVVFQWKEFEIKQTYRRQL